MRREAFLFFLYTAFFLEYHSKIVFESLRMGKNLLCDKMEVSMEKGKLEFFKELLLKKRAELLEEAGKTVDEMNVIAKDNFPDPVDRASMESDRSFDLRIRDRERKLITKVNEALDRIDDGTFGICEVCGGEISEKRLEARPVTTLCIECKQEQEENEKKHH